MHAIWEFPIPIEDEFSIEMPSGASLLHVDVQDGKPCLWAMVQPGSRKFSRRFRLIGTGHPIDEHPGRHVGTFLFDRFVFHLFECDSGTVPL